MCAYFSAQAKPGAWTATLLKALRLVPPETRAAAAAAAQVLPAWCQEAQKEMTRVHLTANGWHFQSTIDVKVLMLCGRALLLCE